MPPTEYPHSAPNVSRIIVYCRFATCKFFIIFFYQYFKIALYDNMLVQYPFFFFYFDTEERFDF